MSKRILITATELHLSQFWEHHIHNFVDNGYCVDVVCSVVSDKLEKLKEQLSDINVNINTVSLTRSPFNLSNINGYKQMKDYLNNNHYDIILTNEPVIGAVTRLAAKKYRKQGTKVIYITHGLHFYKNAPKINWITFYPIEKWLSKYTDEIVTINTEDFDRAKRKFKSKRVSYIHGIGVNTDRLQKIETPGDIRAELGINKKTFLIMSIGELNENKNHKVVIQALGCLNDNSIHYVICGKGDQLENLKKLAEQLGLANNVHFLGYRNDISDICRQSDLFIFPSYREGLGLAPLEAMYCGLPIIASNIRGPVDVVTPGQNGELCCPSDYKEFSDTISKIKSNDELRQKYVENCKEVVKPFCLDSVKAELLDILSMYNQ